MKQEILRLERVTCKTGDRTQLQDVSLSVQEGEIVGLVPVSTYGLESLLAVLLRNEPIYYGYVYYREECVNSWKQDRRGQNPISLIDGNISLVEGMSVAMNLYAFRPAKHDEILRERQMQEMVRPYLDDLAPERFGITINPDEPAERLSPLQSVVVEILRAYMLGHRLIILREIGAVLSEEQVLALSGVLRHYAQRGCAFLYISMHMEEIRQICTKAAVFTNGSVAMVAELENREESGALEQSSYRVYADSLYRSVSGALSNVEPEFPPETLLEILPGDHPVAGSSGDRTGNRTLSSREEARTRRSAQHRRTEGECGPDHGVQGDECDRQPVYDHGSQTPRDLAEEKAEEPDPEGIYPPDTA